MKTANITTASISYSIVFLIIMIFSAMFKLEILDVKDVVVSLRVLHAPAAISNVGYVQTVLV